MTPAHLTHLIRLRADMLRLALEVGSIADNMTGKGAPRARRLAADIARRMRDKAMAPELVEACQRRDASGSAQMPRMSAPCPSCGRPTRCPECGAGPNDGCWDLEAEGSWPPTCACGWKDPEP